MPLPDLDDDSRREALAKAAQARRERAALKAALKSGEMTVAQLLERSSEEVVGKTKVADVLRSLPGVGEKKADRLLDELGIKPSRRVRGLGTNQRRRLLQEFGDRDGAGA